MTPGLSYRKGRTWTKNAKIVHEKGGEKINLTRRSLLRPITFRPPFGQAVFAGVLSSPPRYTCLHLYRIGCSTSTARRLSSTFSNLRSRALSVMGKTFLYVEATEKKNYNFSYNLSRGASCCTLSTRSTPMLTYQDHPQRHIYPLRHQLRERYTVYTILRKKHSLNYN